MKFTRWACLGLMLGSLTAPARADLRWTDEIAASVTEEIEAGTYGQVTSVLILSNGATVYERYFNGADAHTLHDTRSVGKTVTGILAGIAVDQGVLSLDSPLAVHFTDLQPFAHPDARKNALTLEDLLTMSGPLECNDWNQFSRGNEERMYVIEDWSGFFWDLPIRGFPSWAMPPEQADYGRAFSYCTAGVQVVGDAIQRATGENLEAFAQAHLFEPLGIENYDWPRTASGVLHLGGGLRLSTSDWARLGELQRQGGLYGDQRLISEGWMQASIMPHAVINEGPGFLYGYLWWLADRDSPFGTVRYAAMNGNGGNRVFVVPEHDLTVVLTKVDYNTREMHQQAEAFFTDVIAAHLD